MSTIKLINDTTDLSMLKKPVGFDLEVNGVPYDVYRVPGYVHTIGGRWGNNDYWACPMGEKPTFENLLQFNGDAPTWGIAFDRHNYVRDKWDEIRVESTGNCWITRNGRKFYHIPARYMDYGLATAQHELVRLLEECPLNLNMRDWKEKAIGRKIYYKDQPAKITRITADNELWITPDGVDKFKAPVYWDISDWVEYEDGLMMELLSPHIYWFRSDKERDI